MASVIFTEEASRQYRRLPERIKVRMIGIIARLEEWPRVSGAKPLRSNPAGHYRMRTGDYRVQFHLRGQEVIIEKVGHRDRFYEG